MDKPPQPKIAIVGLGYVGLPLSLQFAHSGVQVLGLDIDPDKAERTQQGPELHQACPSDMVAEQVNAHCLAATTDFTRAREVEAVIICVPRPRNACWFICGDLPFVDQSVARRSACGRRLEEKTEYAAL